LDAVAGGDDGTDTISNVETLRFADGDFALDPANTGPQALGGRIVLPQAQTVSHILHGTNADAGDSLTFELVTGPANGTVTVNADGTYTYDPAGFTGTDSFTYRVTDSHGYSADAVMEVSRQDYIPGSYLEGSESQVNTQTAGSQSDSVVSALSDGGYVIVWRSDSGIYSQRYGADGVKIAGELQISSNGLIDVSDEDLDVSGLEGGGFVVTWKAARAEDSDYGIFAQQVSFTDGTDAGSLDGGVLTVNQTLSGVQEMPQVSGLAGGDYVVTWVSGGEIYQRRYDDQGMALTGEELVNSGYTSNAQLDPSVSRLLDGGHIVAWTSTGEDGDAYGIFAQRYDAAGERIGTAFQVNSYVTSNQYQPKVTELSDGGFAMTWKSDHQDGSVTGVFSQAFNADGSKRGSEMQVNGSYSGNQWETAIAGLKDGGYVVSWTDMGGHDGSGAGVFGQRFAADGSKVGGEFLINDETTVDQRFSDLTVLNDGSYVATWSSATTGSWEVFQKLYKGADYSSPSETGTDGNDVLIGNIGADQITGAGGDDLLEGNAGDDIIDGGDGEDIAVFNGVRADYVIEDNGDGTLTVRDLDAVAGGDDGTDTISNVETLRFADGDFALDPANTGPQALGGRIVLPQAQTVSHILHGTNADAGDSLTFELVTGPANGTVTVNADGTYTYDPAGFTGTDSFTYRVTDSHGYSADAVMEVSRQDYIPGSYLEGSESQVNTQTAGSQSDSVVSALSDGGYVIVWRSDSGIYSQRYGADGVKIAGELQISSNGLIDVSDEDLDVSGLEGGGFVVTWKAARAEDSDYGIFAQQVSFTDGTDAGSLDGGVLTVNQTLSGVQEMPQVSGLAGGDYVVTWVSGGEIYQRRYDDQGMALTGEELVNSGYTSNAQLDPSVSRLLDGGHIVAWTSTGEDGDAYGIFAQRYDAAGERIGTAFQVNSYVTSNQYQPKVTELSDGGFAMTWKSDHQDGSVTGVFSQAFNADGSKRGSEMQVNGSYSGNQWETAIAGLKDGGYVVSWTDMGGHDGSGAGVFGQRFAADGSKVGGEFLINDETTVDQRFSDLTVLNDGSYVATWSSATTGSWEVFQKLYKGADYSSPSETGTDGNDVLVGDEYVRVIDGGAGDDLLEAGDPAAGATEETVLSLDGGEYLSRALSSSGSNQTWVFESWVKRDS
ncbi:Ig-like domain-containing protein, partial [Aestuariispira insulae]|uniref:Ig-like domain-containing protein n=1 Tax=Aestuariispira insulae TaxID=1461337 RepID=UPI0015F27DD6